MKLDFTYAGNILNTDEFNNLFSESIRVAQNLLNKKGKGAEYTGWLDIPEKTDDDLIAQIKETASKFINFDAVVVIGIGGSYLGTRAILESIRNPFSTSGPELIFAGHHLSSDYYDNLLEYLTEKKFGIVVISKSGTTTEPAIAFRFLQQLLIEQIGEEEAHKRIVAVTDSKKGALKELCEKQNIESYVIPDDVGGRYSVLTPVGLVPLCIAGVNIDELLEGARFEMNICKKLDKENTAILYATVRNLFYNAGKKIELFTCFDPSLEYIAEWWKQLFGESEGKENKGIFPASAMYTTDLHSLGQYIQEGERSIFETMLTFSEKNNFVRIPKSENNLDNLNYLCSKPLAWVNEMAEQGTCEAHQQGGVPVVKIELENKSAFSLGRLLYFFEFACGVSAYLLDVNPFDQPGVEAYKNNMFRLLGK